MSHKINKKQKELIDSIKFIITCWEKTNDINSPTHFGDINEELNKFKDGTENDRNITLLEDIMEDLYVVIRNTKDE